MKFLALASLLALSVPALAEPPAAGTPAPGETTEAAQPAAASAATAAPSTPATAPAAGAPSNAELKRQLDVLAAEVQRMGTGGGGEAQAPLRADQSVYGLGPAASKIYRTSSGVSIGGYGEFIYDNFAGNAHNGTPVTTDEQRDTIDLARAVVYVGYKFDDHWVLNSEYEFEHKGTDDKRDGSVNAEFAYLDYLNDRALNARLGVVLLPMGFINEYHEPTVFLGPHRPEVETYLIPTTWSEAGAGIFGELGPVTYRSYIVNGMNASQFNPINGVMDGPQGGGQAIAESWANVTRIDYTGTPGLLVGGSFYLGNSVTNIAANLGGGIAIPTHIYEAHLEYKYRGLQFRALGVLTYLDRIAELNAAMSAPPGGSIGSGQRGYYLELGYDLFSGEKQALIPFARYENLNTQMEVPTGFVRDPAAYRQNLTVGVNYKPIEQVVLKADYKELLLGDASGVNSWSLSAGYVF
jgi:hypothetical protein